MLFNNDFTIELDDIPETAKDICFAVAKYCAENSLTYEFESRSSPVIVRIDSRRYEVTKKFAKRHWINLWVLRCKEIKG